MLTVAELPDPVSADGEVLIAVRAFGLNHAEAYIRSGAFGEVAKVTGIEAAGTVVADPSGRLAGGTAVVAILIGMGRTRNGSHAELARPLERLGAKTVAIENGRRADKILA